jgi:hypothetical protein
MFCSLVGVGLVEHALTRLARGASILLGTVARIRHRVADRRGRVRARYLDLGVTTTELLIGWGHRARRFPLTDLAAHIADDADGNSGVLIVDGPGISFRRHVRYRPRRQAEVRAWKFAEAVNLHASPFSDRAAATWVDVYGIRWTPTKPRFNWPGRRRRRHQ